MAKIKLISDLAIGEGNSKKADGLGFQSYARVISESAAGTPGPFTVGIFGEWGTGKTSLLKMVDQYLTDVYPEEIVTVWFNAWQFEQEEHPIVPLIATIIDELEKHESFKTKLKKGGKDFIKALRAIAYGFSAKSKIKIPLVAEFEASLVAKDIMEKGEKLVKDPLLDRSLYYNAFEALSNIDISTKTKIVVLVDDLDRCFPDRAIKLLESIKLVLSQAGFIFVIAVARKVIEGYLKHRYEKDYGIAKFEGQDYLDKIVQLPFTIPPHIGRMEDFSISLLAHIKKEKKDALDALKEILPIIGTTCGNNPRSIIRFINNLIIDKEIFSLMPDIDGVKVSLAHFAITRSLQQWWPGIFDVLTNSPELCNHVAKWSNQNKLKSAMVNDDEKSKELANRIAKDKNLNILLFSKYGKEWLENEELRVAVTEFLSSQRMEHVSPFSEFESDIFISSNIDDTNIALQIGTICSNNGLVPISKTSNGNLNKQILNGLYDSSNNPYPFKAVVFIINEKSFNGLDCKVTSELITEYMHNSNAAIYLFLNPSLTVEDIPVEFRKFLMIELRDEVITDESFKLIIGDIKRRKMRDYRHKSK